MEFFNKKEEVIEIKLTQFGKDLLSRGAFKPVFYRFFDDDIAYNSIRGGFDEHQNDTQVRILEETPKLKTQSITMGIETRFLIEQELIEAETRSLFQPIHKSADPYVQEKILLYPIGSHNVDTQQAPRIKVAALDEKFEQGVTFLNGTGSGISKNIPQLSITSSFLLSEDRSNLTEPTLVNAESFFNLANREIVFADNSKISISGKSLLIDLEEYNVFNGLDNFELEIYEVVKRKDDKVLTRIGDLNKINELFHIKTDNDVQEVEEKTRRKSNYYRSDEN